MDKNIVFAHGLESSPQGRKAIYLREKLGATVPWLGELGLTGQVEALREKLEKDAPGVLVGSSLGGLAALGTADKYPSLVSHLVLLAPAVGMARFENVHTEVEERRPGLFRESKAFSELSVPSHIACTIIHGLKDDVILTEDVLALARRSPSSRLILVHDEHSLVKSDSLILSVVTRAAKVLDPLCL